MQKEGNNFHKPREMPIIFPVTERMLLRLPPDSSEYKRVFDQMDSARAGFNGEQQVERHLSKLPPSSSLVILSDLFIQINPNWSIQIDTLIITDKYILILEVKTFRGILHFEENPFALIQEVNGEPQLRKCPQLQVISYKDGLHKWLFQLGLHLPIYTCIVLGYPTVLVKTPPKQVPLLQAQQVPLHINQLNNSQKSRLSPEEFKRLVEVIQMANDPFLVFPLSKYYRIDSSLIKSGIICEQCGTRMQRRNHKMWSCHTCSFSSSNAPLRAIEEWLMNMKTTISNEECRQWLGLKDKHAAGYLLRNSSLAHTGLTKGRTYYFEKLQYEIIRK